MLPTRLFLVVILLCVALWASTPCGTYAQETPDIAQALAKADAPLPEGYPSENFGGAPGIAPDFATECPPDYTTGCGTNCDCRRGHPGAPNCGRGASCGCGSNCECGTACGCSTSCDCGSNCESSCGCGQYSGPAPGYACGPCYDCGPMCCGYPSDCDRWYVSFGTATQYREEVHEVGDRWTFIKFDEGFQANAAIGYSFDSCRVELETSFMNNGVDRAGVFGFSSSSPGNVNLRALMFNVYRDFRFDNCCWEPYIGGGIGVYQSEINGVYPRFFEVIGEPFEGNPINATSDVELAYQLRAGVTRPIGRRTEFYTGYRFFAGDDQSVSTAPLALFNPTWRLNGADLHALELGFRVRF